MLRYFQKPRVLQFLSNHCKMWCVLGYELLRVVVEDSVTCVNVRWEMNDQTCVDKMFYAAWNSLNLILTSENLNFLSPTFTVWTIIFVWLSVCLNVFFIICNSSWGKVMFLQAWKGTCMCGGGGVHGYLVSLMMSWWQSRSCWKKQTFHCRVNFLKSSWFVSRGIQHPLNLISDRKCWHYKRKTALVWHQLSPKM